MTISNTRDLPSHNPVTVYLDRNRFGSRAKTTEEIRGPTDASDQAHCSQFCVGTTSRRTLRTWPATTRPGWWALSATTAAPHTLGTMCQTCTVSDVTGGSTTTTGGSSAWRKQTSWAKATRGTDTSSSTCTRTCAARWRARRQRNRTAGCPHPVSTCV